MTDQRTKRDAAWVWLLVLPALCCAAHAVLLALGVGSVAAIVGGRTGGAALAGVSAVLVLAAVAALLVRRRDRQ